MAQQFLLDEDHQLPAKIVRAVIWSGTMALLWTWPSLLLGSACAVTFGTFIAGWVFALSAVTWLAGGITGSAAFLCARDEQMFGALRSSVFRSFSRQVGIPTGVTVVISFLILSEFPFDLLLPLIVFVASLASAVQNQLDENKVQLAVKGNAAQSED